MDMDELDALDPVEVLDPAKVDRTYHVVIYGATGFTGCLMVQHLDALAAAREETGGSPLRWAIAGRDKHKLRRVGRGCKSAPGIIEAATPAEISRMASQCQVVAAAAGPYAACGEDVVRECLNHVTHYVDVSGETAWIHDMIRKYHTRARAKGVMIVHSVGAVCGPDEVLCYSLVKKLGPLKQFREYFLQSGGQSGGTFATTLETMKNMTPETLAVMNDPFCLGGARRCGVRKGDKDCTQAMVDSLFPSLWLTPAYNSSCGSRIIRRTCGLFEDTPADGLEYGQELLVQIRGCTSSEAGASKTVQEMAPAESVEHAAEAAAAMRESAKNGVAPAPGHGPPAATRARHGSEVYGVAEGESGRWAYARYTAGESYEVTAMLCIAGALLLAEEPEAVRPKERGGVLTPAFAFHGSTWVERFTGVAFANSKEGRRITVEVFDGKPAEEEVKRAMQQIWKTSGGVYAQIMKGELKAWDAPALIA